MAQVRLRNPRPRSFRGPAFPCALRDPGGRGAHRAGRGPGRALRRVRRAGARRTAGAILCRGAPAHGGRARARRVGDPGRPAARPEGPRTREPAGAGPAGGGADGASALFTPCSSARARARERAEAALRESEGPFPRVHEPRPGQRLHQGRRRPVPVRQREAGTGLPTAGGPVARTHGRGHHRRGGRPAHPGARSDRVQHRGNGRDPGNRRHAGRPDALLAQLQISAPGPGRPETPRRGCPSTSPTAKPPKASTNG